MLCGLIWACADGDTGGSDSDAEVDVDMEVRVINDMLVVDAAPVDMGGADMMRAADVGIPPDGGPQSACADGLDNDRDGQIDFPADPGCTDADDDDETDPVPVSQCDDRVDNDADGLIDAADSDCNTPLDPSESGDSPTRACNNGIDDDDDGLTDFPFDPGCETAGGISEADRVPAPACANGMDDDGNGMTDFPMDPGCVAAGDATELALDPPPACANGADDDGTGALDWPADPGCDGAGDLTEVSPCGPQTPVIDLNQHLLGDEDFQADLTDVPAGLVAECGGAAGGEYVFRYVVQNELDRLVFDTRHPETVAPVVMYLRDQCRGPDLQCNRGLADAPGVALTIERPAIGAAYYVVVDTGSRMVIGRFRLTVDAVAPPACRDSIDNDEDGLLDLADPGCTETEDDDEGDPLEPPVCANGLDDDMDGFIDWPDDPDCAAAGAAEEVPPCTLGAPILRVGQAGGDFPLAIVAGIGTAQGRCEQAPGAENVIALVLTDPSDVEVQVLDANGMPALVSVHARSVCEDPMTEIGCRTAANRIQPLALTELARGQHFIFAEQGLVAPREPLTARVIVRSTIVACNDLIDNDDDGLIDLADWGCERGRDESERDAGEATQCSDGIDNDENGLIDWPEDEGCLGAGDLTEAPLGIFIGLRGFGHHGNCETFNACNDARTCANAACEHLGHGPALEFEDGLCGDLMAMFPDFQCSLFNQIPNQLDADWNGGGFCNIPVAYNILCAPN